MVKDFLTPTQLADYLEEHGVPRKVQESVIERFWRFDLPRQIIERAKLNGQGQLGSIKAEELTMKKSRWLWKETGDTIIDEDQWIPMDGLTLMTGREATGKSTWCFQLAADVTRGILPGDLEGTPRSVLIASTEDEPSYTIVPRLAAAGADMGRVHFPDRALHFPDDLELFIELVTSIEPALIVLDPLLGTVGATLDSHKDQEIRLMLEPLTRLAHERQLAMIGLVHVNKSTTKDLMTQVMGSRAIVAVPRAVLMCIKDVGPDGPEYHLGQIKSNLGPEVQKTIQYTIGVRAVGHDAETGDTITGSFIDRGGTVDMSLDMVVGMASDSKKGPAPDTRDAVKSWLEERLADGPASSKEVLKEAASALNCSERTVHKAKKELGVTSIQQDRIWYWALEGSS